MKTDICAELYLWNKNIDSLIRVLQRMEALGVSSRQVLNEHERRLEELRVVLNSEVLEALLKRERNDSCRLNVLRSAAEEFRARNTNHSTKH